MGKVKIGFSRIYNASACSNEKEGDISATIHFGLFDVYFHAGTGLKHHVFTMKLGPPVPQDKQTEIKPSRSKPQQIPKQADFPADYYVEIFAQRWLEVEDALADAFYAGDLAAQNHLSELLKQQKDEFLTAVDFTAGLFGLKVHKLLVLKVIHEQYYIYKDEHSTVFSLDIDVTVTGTYLFDQEGAWQTAIKKAESNLSGKWKDAAKPLAWLLRAWGAEDRVLRCFSLLTALEQVIPGGATMEEKVWSEARSKVLSLLNLHADPLEADKLISWVESAPRPATPILTRFQIWAETADQPGWKKDIGTFKKFNRIRNQLFHTGTPAADHKIKIVLKQLEELEDVAERYVSLALFKDMTVYKHPLREKE
jgi:hypothetical protein